MTPANPNPENAVPRRVSEPAPADLDHLFDYDEPDPDQEERDHHREQQEYLHEAASDRADWHRSDADGWFYSDHDHAD